MTASRFPFPKNCRYDAVHHTWVRPEPSGWVRIGVDVLGLEQLGDLAYVTLEAPGTVLTRGEPAGSVESAKMTGPLISPLSGRVAARNDLVLDNPALVNDDPYEAGWLLMVEPSRWEEEHGELVGDEQLDAWVTEELARFREEGWLE